MPEPLLRHGTWFAICDGQRALLLENQGDHAYPNLQTRETFKQENPAAHLQGSAPPGRTFSSMGTHRSAAEETDFHVQAAEAFLRNFAEKLNHCVEERKIHALVLIAPARALGLIRPHLSQMTRRILTAELDRDYVKMPLYEIERHLAAMP
jgi:protein required for attachment to host cells